MDRTASSAFDAVRASLSQLSGVTDTVAAGTPRLDALRTGTEPVAIEADGNDSPPSPSGGFTLREYVRNRLAIFQRKAGRGR